MNEDVKYMLWMLNPDNRSEYIPGNKPGNEPDKTV